VAPLVEIMYKPEIEKHEKKFEAMHSKDAFQKKSRIGGANINNNVEWDC
jgi:hypothetical protein